MDVHYYNTTWRAAIATAKMTDGWNNQQLGNIPINYQK